MIEQIQRECAALRSELATLHGKVETLQAEGAGARAARYRERCRVLRRLVIGAMALAAPLAAGVLYGQGAGDALFIDQQGRVGIGTTTPDPMTRLHVAGPVLAEGFRTDSGLSLAGVQDGVKMMVPVGTILAYGGDTASVPVADQLRKQGWLPCNGQSVSRQEYADLFAAIGTAFGADAQNTFRVPDLRGRFLRGTDQGQKRDPDAASRRAEPSGGNSGDQVGSVQDDIIGEHRHALVNPTGWSDKKSTEMQLGTFTSKAQVHRTEVNDGAGKETRPKNVNVNWIIKARPLPVS